MMVVILVVLALSVVAVILLFGLSTLWVGGDYSKKWSNRLMRYRIIAQFVAIVVMMAVVYLYSH